MRLPAVTTAPTAPAGTARIYNRPITGAAAGLRLVSESGRVLSYDGCLDDEFVGAFAPSAQTTIQRPQGHNLPWSGRDADYALGDGAAVALGDRFLRTTFTSGTGLQDSCYWFPQPIGSGDVIVSRRAGFHFEVTRQLPDEALVGSVSVVGFYGAPIVPADVATSAPDVFVVGWRADAPDLSLRLFHRRGTDAHTVLSLPFTRNGNVRTYAIGCEPGGPLYLAIHEPESGLFHEIAISTNIPDLDTPGVIESVQGNWLTLQTTRQRGIRGYLRCGRGA